MAHSKCLVSVSYYSYAVQFMFGREILGQQESVQKMEMSPRPLMMGRTSCRRGVTSDGRGEITGATVS